MMRRRLVVANLVALAVLVATVAARLPPGTPATNAAVEQVRREVEYITRTTDLPREYVTALAVNSYVVGHVSRMTYGYLEGIGAEVPGGEPAEIAEEALTSGAGLCGAATQTALALYARLGVEARSIQAFYEHERSAGGHITTEVFYDGAWHWFDPMWGSFFRDDDHVLSLAEVVRSSPERQAATLVYVESLPFVQVTGLGPEFVAYSPLHIVLDGRIVYRRDVTPRRRSGSRR